MALKLVFLAVACIFSVCQSAAVPEEVAQPQTQRLGTFNRYYLSSWDHIVSGHDWELVGNDDSNIGTLTLTGTERVAIVVHGRESSVHSEFGYTLRNAMIQADRNMAVILVDWSLVASLNYDQACAFVPSVAEDLVLFITRMETAGKLDRSLLHLIGFDLGAHVVGITSRHSAARARKITALSPAGSRWDLYSQRLRATDADFVEAIHTDANGTAFGVPEGIGGGLEFFPNGGAEQPGCADGDHWCYHNRSWKLFSATVDFGGHLIGLRCDSMAQVNSNSCVGIPTAVLGTLELIKLPLGLYRVNTGGVYPYRF